MSPHMLLAQALAPPIYGDVKSAVPMQELRQNDPPSLQHLSADMLSLHSALQAPFAQETTLHDMLAFYPTGRPHPTCAHVLTNYDGSLRMDVDPSSYTPQTDDVDPSSLETLARLAALRIQQTEGNPAAFVPLVHVDAYGIKQPKEGRTKIADKGKDAACSQNGDSGGGGWLHSGSVPSVCWILKGLTHLAIIVPSEYAGRGGSRPSVVFILEAARRANVSSEPGSTSSVCGVYKLGSTPICREPR